MITLMCKRQYAEEIIKGTKKWEFRCLTPHFASRAFDKKTMDAAMARAAKYIDDEEEFFKAYDDIVHCPLSDNFSDGKICLTNYNRTWELIIKISFVAVSAFIFEDDIAYFSEMIPECSVSDFEDMAASNNWYVMMEIEDVISSRGLI